MKKIISYIIVLMLVLGVVSLALGGAYTPHNYFYVPDYSEKGPAAYARYKASMTVADNAIAAALEGRSFPPVSTGTTYYVDATLGKDTYNGTTTTINDGASQGPWKTFAKVYSAGLTAGDSVLLKKGEQWREEFVFPASGTSGSQITLSSYGTGAIPVINGSDLCNSGWTNDGSNVWKKTVTTQPLIVWFDSAMGTLVANKAAVNGAGKWWWSTNILYVYSTSDPATAFTSPGIEAGSRVRCLFSDWGGTSYITVDGIEVKNSNATGIKTVSSNYWQIRNCIVHNCGARDEASAHCIIIQESSNNLIEFNTVYEGGSHGIYLYDLCNNNIMQNNTVYDCHHSGVDNKQLSVGYSTGNIWRYNKLYNSYAAASIPFFSRGGTSTSEGIVNLYVHDNIVYDLFNTDPDINGIHIGVYVNSAFVYNNTVVGIGGACIYLDDNADVITVKNNIMKSTGASGECLRVIVAANKTIDYNCYQTTSGYIASVGSGGGNVDYQDADWTTPYKTDTGWETHGVHADPKIVSTSDFHLQSSSPCIDAGVAMTGRILDYEGKVVPQGSAPDIGALEYTP